jgi:hypothetical protein
MVNGLYTLYEQRFFSALERAAAERRVNSQDGQRPLFPAEISEMYSLYAGRAQSLSGAITAYCDSREIPGLLKKLQAMESSAYDAYSRLIAAMEIAGPNAASHPDLQRAYQEAVVRREQARENVAAAMRRGGHTRTMDSDTLVYVAMWLNRRGESGIPGLKTLGSTLERVAKRFEQAELQWQQSAAPQ